MPVQHAVKTGAPQYIRYTPSQQAGNFNSGAQQRIIRMVEAQQDPMEPPKFKYSQFLIKLRIYPESRKFHNYLDKF
jgi:SNW domain-containing protein 1